MFFKTYWEEYVRSSAVVLISPLGIDELFTYMETVPPENEEFDRDKILVVRDMAYEFGPQHYMEAGASEPRVAFVRDMLVLVRDSVDIVEK